MQGSKRQPAQCIGTAEPSAGLVPAIRAAPATLQFLAKIRGIELAVPKPHIQDRGALPIDDNLKGKRVLPGEQGDSEFHLRR